MAAKVLRPAEGCTADCFEFVIQPLPEGLLVVSLDITGRKHVETALRESAAKGES
jgi:hypothetical protein